MGKGNSGGGGVGEEIIDSVWGVSSKRGEEKDSVRSISYGSNVFESL